MNNGKPTSLLDCIISCLLENLFIYSMFIFNKTYFILQILQKGLKTAQISRFFNPIWDGFLVNFNSVSPCFSPHHERCPSPVGC